MIAALAAFAALAGPGDYVGLPVAYVRIEGADTEESLDPLLRMRQGMLYDPASVRADLTTLSRVGEFASVEAVVDPWTLAEEGGDVPAVLVTYRVAPASRLQRVRVEGADEARARDLIDAARVTLRVPWYPELDAPVAEFRVQAWLVDQGFPDASVTSRSVDVDGRTELVLTVDEGAPDRVAEVRFAGDAPISERRLRGFARRAGVREGQPVGANAIERSTWDMRGRLAELPGPFTPRGGWVSARVQAASSPASDGRVVTYFIEAGPRLQLEVEGLGWWRRRERVREALTIDERVRLTRAFLDLAPGRLEDHLQRRGWLDADAQVTLTERPPDEGRDPVSTLRVEVDRGARYTLTNISVEGSSTFEPRHLSLVMMQASPEVLRRRRVTPPEIEKGLEAVRQLFVANGHPDATVSLLAQERGVRRLGPRGTGVPHPWDALRHLTGIELVRLHLGVEAGRLQTFGGVVIEGAAPGVDLVADALIADELTGAAHSPPTINQLARQVVQRHQAAGYLDADARVVSSEADDVVSVRIIVEPGDQVLLRSVTTRGATRTRGDFLRNEIDLALGAPVSSADLEALRGRLAELEAFRSVRPDLLGDGRQRDLLVTVEERAPWGFEAGGGASTDQGVRVFGRAIRRNLWGIAHRMEAYAQAGFLWSGEELTDWVPDVTNPDWRAALTYVAPRFPTRSQKLLIEWLLREERQERAWRLARAGVGAVIDNRVSDVTTLRVEARVERRTLAEIDTGALLAGEPWTYLVDVTDPVLPSSHRYHTALSGLVLHDLRDDPLQPTRGVLLSASGSWSPALATPAVPDEAEINWVSGVGRASGYLPAGAVTLHVSAEFGASAALGGGVIALEDRFRLGGTGSMRGFSRDGVGPRNEVAQPQVAWPDAIGPMVDYVLSDAPTRWVATGGDARAMTTIELLFPLSALGLGAWDGYSAALFSDIGNTWLLTDGAAASSDSEAVRAVYEPLVRYSAGVGVRIATPIGPLQVDVAVNPDALFATDDRRLLLRGAWEEPSVRAHLSLGTLW